MELVTDIAKNQSADYLVSTIASQLQQGKSVLWLVPGGSAMTVAAKVSQNLGTIDTSKLYVTLTDERYGEQGHSEENWIQLENLGFSLGLAQGYRVLTGEDVGSTTKKYNDKLVNLFDICDFKIGFFGIGADGHTAGIKPGSVAVESDNYAESFVGDDFERITMTTRAVGLLDEVVAFAYGDEKHQALERLLTEEVTLSKQPAQILKKVKKSTLFSDLVT